MEARPDSQFFTVPKLYPISATLSSSFYRFGYFLAIIYMTKQVDSHTAVADRPARTEVVITPQMIEAGVAKLLSSGLIIPEYEGSFGALAWAVRSLLEVSLSACGVLIAK